MSQARKQQARAAVDLLAQTFPAAFNRYDRKPLKLGVAEDLLARGIAPDVIKTGLRRYCHGADYLRRMQPARRGSTWTATRRAW
jgi:sRNA-binding protein